MQIQRVEDALSSRVFGFLDLKAQLVSIGVCDIFTVTTSCPEMTVKVDDGSYFVNAFDVIQFKFS